MFESTVIDDALTKKASKISFALRHIGFRTDVWRVLRIDQTSDMSSLYLYLVESPSQRVAPISNFHSSLSHVFQRHNGYASCMCMCP